MHRGSTHGCQEILKILYLAYLYAQYWLTYAGAPRREPNRMADPATLPVSDATSADPSTGIAGASVSLDFEPSSQAAGMPQENALAAPPTAVSGVMGMVGSVRERGSRLLQTQKPWAELFDRTAFSKPASIGEATSRCAFCMLFNKVMVLCETKF